MAELLGPVLEPLGGFADVGSAAISFAVAYALVSVLHVVVGELAPKSLAIARTRPTGLAFAPPMRLFYLATKPISGSLLATPNPARRNLPARGSGTCHSGRAGGQ